MNTRVARFNDRSDAGRQLATQLVTMRLDRPVVYALPRGGVPVGLEIARALHAPLEIVLVRKIGAPHSPELALGAVVDGENPQTVINEDVRRLTGASDDFLERARRREVAEIERRRALYLGSHRRVEPAGRTCIIVDDGLATGATAKAALNAIRQQGAVKIVLAVPVAPRETLAEMREHADSVLCLHAAREFHGVGSFYADFHQLTDEETIGLLHEAWSAAAPDLPEQGAGPVRYQVTVPPLHLAGELCVPPTPHGIVLFAHGSGSSRLSPRNIAVADSLNSQGFATLLFDLLTEAEAPHRRHVFDIPLLAQRLLHAVEFMNGEPGLAGLPLGLFGASTGAGAALFAAAELDGRVSAVVSRSGRPDLAGARLAEVTAPTLLIVGGNDEHVLHLNRQALAALTCDKSLKVVPHAGHLFEEAGALETVTTLACDWFQRYLSKPPVEPR